jgi:hypothetical protein
MEPDGLRNSGAGVGGVQSKVDVWSGSWEPSQGRPRLCGQPVGKLLVGMPAWPVPMLAAGGGPSRHSGLPNLHRTVKKTQRE